MNKKIVRGVIVGLVIGIIAGLLAWCITGNVSCLFAWLAGVGAFAAYMAVS